VRLFPELKDEFLLWLKDKENQKDSTLKIPITKPSITILATDDAMVLWQKAYHAGLVDNKCQPTMNGMRRASILARAIGEKLNLNPLWEPFERLWNANNLCNSNSQAVKSNYFAEVAQLVDKALQ